MFFTGDDSTWWLQRIKPEENYHEAHLLVQKLTKSLLHIYV